MVNIILDIIGLLTGTCKTEHRERLFHAVHQITQRGMRSVDSLLYLNLHARWSVCLSLFVTLVIKNSVRRSDDSQSRVILITTKMRDFDSAISISS